MRAFGIIPALLAAGDEELPWWHKDSKEEHEPPPRRRGATMKAEARQTRAAGKWRSASWKHGTWVFALAMLALLAIVGTQGPTPPPSDDVHQTGAAGADAERWAVEALAPLGLEPVTVERVDDGYLVVYERAAGAGTGDLPDPALVEAALSAAAPGREPVQAVAIP